MKTSETVKELIPALMAARANIGTIVKTAENDFIKNKGKAFKYAPLDVVLEAVLPALTEQGLFLSQDNAPTSSVDLMVVETTIFHTSGEWVKYTHDVCMGKKDPQGSGSCHTYGKRYALNGIFGLCAKNEDDDANGAMPVPTTVINGETMIKGANGWERPPEAQNQASAMLQTIKGLRLQAGLSAKELVSLLKCTPSASLPLDKLSSLVDQMTDFIERKESNQLTNDEIKLITGEAA